MTDKVFNRVVAEDMQPHPEGGRYRRVFCSEVPVTQSGKGERPAISHIYFELQTGERSSLHRVENDEIWNLYSGAGVMLYLWDGTSSAVVRRELSIRSNCFCQLIPAGYWQAAEPLVGRVLVGCSVAPAFEFTDFSLLRDNAELLALFVQSNPQLKRLL